MQDTSSGGVLCNVYFNKDKVGEHGIRENLHPLSFMLLGHRQIRVCTDKENHKKRKIPFLLSLLWQKQTCIIALETTASHLLLSKAISCLSA